MKRIILYGLGEIGRCVLEYSLKADVQLLFVCDNNKRLWGSQIKGYEICPPARIFETDYDKLLLCVANGIAVNEIYDQLQSKGVPKEKIVFSYSHHVFGYCYSPVEEFFDIPRKPLTPFQKGVAEIYTDYVGETAKSHDRRVREGFFEKYCQGEGLDIGYGADLIVPGCSGWDLQNGNAQYLEGVEDESFDYVYSSHCLEHMWDVRVALKNWFRVVRKGGYLIIAIPHRDLYEKKRTLPSRWNGDHKHMFLIGKAEEPDTLDIVSEIRNSLSCYDIKYVKTCDEGFYSKDDMTHSEGEFQIEAVIQKI